MKDQQMSKHNINDVWDLLVEEVKTSELIILNSSSPKDNKYSMARLFRMWMMPTAKFMHDTGCSMPLCFDKNGNPYGKRRFDSNDAYELFTALHGGVDANGNRLSWTKKGRDDLTPADNGQRFDMLRKHEMWASDRGVILMKPRDSEYWKLQEDQNK